MGRSLLRNAKNFKTLCVSPHWVLKLSSSYANVGHTQQGGRENPHAQTHVSTKSIECAQGAKRIFNMIQPWTHKPNALSQEIQDVFNSRNQAVTLQENTAALDSDLIDATYPKPCLQYFLGNLKYF